MAQANGYGGGAARPSDYYKYFDEYAKRAGATSNYPGSGGDDPEIENRTNELLDKDLSGKSSLEILYSNANDLYAKNRDLAIQEAKRAAQQTQDDLRRQMDEQRSNLKQGRQDIMRNSYMRGRNNLQGLANRGLATSGLLQVGDVRNTVAQGQQVNALTGAFNQVQGDAQRQLDRSAQGLSAQLAGLNLDYEGKVNANAMDQYGKNVTLNEQLLAYGNEEASLLAQTTDPEAKAAISAQYAQLRNAIQGGGQAGDYVSPDGRSAAQIIASTIEDETTYGTENDPAHKAARPNLESYQAGSAGEQRALTTEWLDGNPGFNSSNQVVKDLKAAGGKGAVVTDLPGGKTGKVGYNDDYRVSLNGNDLTLSGGQLAAMIMSGSIEVPLEIIKSISSGATGSFASPGTIFGRKYDAISKAFEKYLIDNNFMTKDINGYYWTDEQTQ